MSVTEQETQPDLERAEGECLATFWRQATPGTTYWRCIVPARYLPGQSLGFTTNDINFDEEHQLMLMPRQKGAAVWQFLGDDARSRVAFALRDMGVKTLQEVDDNYLRPTVYSHGAWRRTIVEASKAHGYSHEQHRHITPMFDGVICSTENLAEAYSSFNDNVYLCPNSVDPNDWDIPRHTDDVLRIGYYGSASHSKDWPYAKKALKWASRQPGVEVLLIGFTPPGWSGPVLPWAHRLEEARMNLGQLDVGICPLHPTDWANGKSDVKALEYAMAGVLPIVSRTEPYSPWHRRGWNFTAQTADEWMECIRHVVRNRDMVKGWAQHAKDYVLEERTIQGNIHLWREAING